MIQGFNAKTVIALDTSTATSGATETARIDHLGFAAVTLDVELGSVAGTTGQPTVLAISESNDTNASNFANVTNFVGGTALGANVGFVIPAGNTSAAQIVKFDIDCRARKRYLLVTLTCALQQVVNVRGALFRPTQLPITAANLGVTTYVAG